MLQSLSTDKNKQRVAGATLNGDFNDEERRELQALIYVLRDFIEMRPNMPLHQIVVMLCVALDEGKSLKHYADKLDYPTSSVSRTFLDNGPKMRTGDPGLQLLEAKPSPQNLREHNTFLTTKGKTLFRNVARKLLVKRS